MSKSKQMIEQQSDEQVNVQYDQDYLYSLYEQQEKMNEEYWEEQARIDAIDTINSMYQTRFCYGDVIAAVMEVTGDEQLAEHIGNAVNGIYVRRLTFDSYGIQQIQVVDKEEEK